RIWRSRLVGRLARLRQQRILLSLHRLDLLEQQFDPVKLAAHLRLQMRRQRPTVARAQGLKSGPPVATQRRIAGDALREQKALDPVHMPDALIDQGPPFAAKPAAILLLRRGRNNHRTDPWLPAL